MAKVLIVGSDGPIGRALEEDLIARGDEVFATTRRLAQIGSPGRIFLDLADPTAVETTPLPDVDAVIICAAIARFADCRAQPELARQVNVRAPAALASRLARKGASIVLLSTSAVFDCTTPLCRADHPRAPRSAYGAFKAEAEDQILALGRQASVLRLTKVLDPAMPLINHWIGALQAGNHVRAFVDHGLSPILLRDVVLALCAILDDGAGGIYQISGAGDLSYADAAQYLASRLGVGVRLVERVSALETGIDPGEITLYTSLDASRLAMLTGWSPPQPRDVIDSAFAHRLTA